MLPSDFHNFLRNTLRGYVWSTGAFDSAEDLELRAEFSALLEKLQTRKGSKRFYKAFIDSV